MNSVTRLEALKNRLMSADEPGLEAIEAALSSCDDPEHPVCRIPNPDGPAGSVPGLIAFTTGSMISALRTHSQAIDSWVSAGPPCVRAYEHVSLTRT